MRPAGEQAETETIWLRALNLIRKNPRSTMLPLLITQMPFALGMAATFFWLFYNVYPDAEFDSFNWLADAPGGIRITMAMLGAAVTLFAVVGAAATMVVVAGLQGQAPVRLPQALDPAFTRMGGLLVFSLFFNVLFLASFAGLFVLLYFVIRFGVVVQAYILGQNTISGAFGESWRLLRGRMFKFMSLLLTAIPLGIVVLLGTSFAFGLIAAPFGSEPGRTTELVFQSVAMFILVASFVPIGAYIATSTTMFYLSARDDAHA
jgi:hypothetical protein